MPLPTRKLTKNERKKMTQQCPEIDKTSDAYRFKDPKTIINLIRSTSRTHPLFMAVLITCCKEKHRIMPLPTRKLTKNERKKMTQQCPEIDKTSDAYRFKDPKTIINLIRSTSRTHPLFMAVLITCCKEKHRIMPLPTRK